MDVAADFTTGIWVEAVATEGVGAVEFTGVVGVGVVGMGWAITLILYHLLASMVLFLSFILGLGAFLVMVLLFRDEHWCLVVTGLVVAGSGVGAWVWDQAYPLILNTSSSSR